MRRQLLVASFLAASVVIAVGFATHRPGAHPRHTTVAALTSDSARAGSVSLTGYVQPASRHYEGYSQWRFTLQDQNDSVAVRYKGVVPSTFREGAQVMVVGRMQGETFVATWVGVRM